MLIKGVARSFIAPVVVTQRYALPACGWDCIMLINQYKLNARTKAQKTATNPTGQVHAVLGGCVAPQSACVLDTMHNFLLWMDGPIIKLVFSIISRTAYKSPDNKGHWYQS